MVKSLPCVKDVVPGYTAQVQLNVEGNIENTNVYATEHRENAMAKAKSMSNIENTNVYATEPTVAFAISPSLTLVAGSSIQNNNTNAMLVGYNIANPPPISEQQAVQMQIPE